MQRREYDEFDLLLGRTEEGYRARVTDSPVGPTKEVSFSLPGTAESLKVLVLTLRAVRGVRALESDTAPEAKRYGGQLFDAVFHDEVRNALRGSLHVAGSAGRGLRLRLRFEDPAGLADVPWELLYDTERHRFLCQYGKYPVVRFLEIPEPIEPLRVDGPVRMLVVISSPRDFPALDAEKEWEHLEGVLAPLVAAGRLVVDRLEPASLAEIHRALLDEEYHVVHYIGHGGVDPRSGEGVLALEGPDRAARLETGHDLGVMLSNSPIRLVVLNSCEGARISEVDPYAGTAISLVEQGIPAVVAMQFEISDEAALAFSGTLYDAITEGRRVDVAVTLARQAILATSRSEWATPVLYLRAKDGVIFDIPHPAQVTPAATTAAAAAALAGELAGPVTPPPGATTAPAPVTGPTAVSSESSAQAPAPEAATTAEHAPTAPQEVVPTAGWPPRTSERAPTAPTAPTAPVRPRRVVPAPWGLEARPEQGKVVLRWRQEDDALVDHWVVLRNGAPIGDVVGTLGAVDESPPPGAVAYAVLSVGPNGRPGGASEEVVVDVPRRRRWGWLVAVLAVLAVALGAWAIAQSQDGTDVVTPDDQGQVEPAPAPDQDPGGNGGGQVPEAPTADVRVAVDSASPGAGSGEFDVPLTVSNAGGSSGTGSVTVSIEIQGSARLLFVQRQGGGQLDCPERTDTRWVCQQPGLDPGDETALLAIVLVTDASSSEVVVDASGETEDPDPDNNSDSATVP